MTRMGFLINLDTCLDHRGCQTACKANRNTPMGIYHNETFTVNDNNYPDPNQYFINILCQQCDNPSCVPACTAGALTKRDDGIVIVSDQGACAECKDPLCQKACPYGAIHHDPITKKTYKCDMCYDRIAEGKDTFCVGGCLTGSRMFGDFDDPTSVVSQVVEQLKDHVYQLKPETGNGPNVYYVLSKQRWDDMNHLYTPNWHDPELSPSTKR